MQLEQLQELAKSRTPFLVKISPEHHRLDTARYSSFFAEVKEAKIYNNSVLLTYEVSNILNQHINSDAQEYFSRVLQKTSTGWCGTTVVLTQEAADAFTLMNVCSTEGCSSEFSDAVFSTMAKRYLPVLGVEPKNNEDDPLSAEHLAWMLMELVQNPTMSESKKHRWLGYVQGCMVSQNLITVKEERNATRPIFNGK